MSQSLQSSRLQVLFSRKLPFIQLQFRHDHPIQFIQLWLMSPLLWIRVIPQHLMLLALSLASMRQRRKFLVLSFRRFLVKCTVVCGEVHVNHVWRSFENFCPTALYLGKDQLLVQVAQVYAFFLQRFGSLVAVPHPVAEFLVSVFFDLVGVKSKAWGLL